MGQLMHCRGMTMSPFCHRYQPPSKSHLWFLRNSGDSAARLDLCELDRATEKYTAHIKSGQNKFCREGGFVAVPATESVLCHFIAHLAEAGLKSWTLKVYLSAVRFLHIAEGRGDLFV